jgi:hypothetical protein
MLNNNISKKKKYSKRNNSKIKRNKLKNKTNSKKLNLNKKKNSRKSRRKIKQNLKIISSGKNSNKNESNNNKQNNSPNDLSAQILGLTINNPERSCVDDIKKEDLFTEFNITEDNHKLFVECFLTYIKSIKKISSCQRLLCTNDFYNTNRKIYLHIILNEYYNIFRDSGKVFSKDNINEFILKLNIALRTNCYEKGLGYYFYHEIKNFISLKYLLTFVQLNIDDILYIYKFFNEQKDFEFFLENFEDNIKIISGNRTNQNDSKKKIIIVNETKINDDNRIIYLNKLNNVKKLIVDYLKIKNEILTNLLFTLKDVEDDFKKEILEEMNREKIPIILIKLILDIIRDIEKDTDVIKRILANYQEIHNIQRNTKDILSKFIEKEIINDLVVIEEIEDYFGDKCNVTNSIICSKGEEKLYMCKENKHCNDGKKEIEDWTYICDGECNSKQ